MIITIRAGSSESHRFRNKWVYLPNGWRMKYRIASCQVGRLPPEQRPHFWSKPVYQEFPGYFNLALDFHCLGASGPSGMGLWCLVPACAIKGGEYSLLPFMDARHRILVLPAGWPRPSEARAQNGCLPRRELWGRKNSQHGQFGG